MEKSSTRVFTSIFEGDKLKEGVYMIQNLHTESYLDVRLRSMELCCRPVNDLEAGRGLVRLCSPLRIRLSDDLEVGNQEIWGRIYDIQGKLGDSISPLPRY